MLVAVDRLAQQRDLPAAFVGQLPGLGDDMLAGGRLCSGPRTLGHDAVGAELVAADHDPHERLERRRPHRGSRSGIVALEAALDRLAAAGSCDRG